MPLNEAGPRAKLIDPALHYEFLLTSPVAYKHPIPYRGQLGLFQVEEDELVGHR